LIIREISFLPLKPSYILFKLISKYSRRRCKCLKSDAKYSFRAHLNRQLNSMLSTHASLVSNFRRTVSHFFSVRYQLLTFNSVKVSRRGFASRAIKERREWFVGSRPFSLAVIRHLTSQLDEFTFLIDRLSSLSLLLAATEAISCANKLRWIKLHDSAWIKFIV